MANPFLVLGGIAIGVITAAFGVLSVPGWVASAQDAAAQNDLGNAVLAQNASLTRTGAAIGNVTGLTDANGMKFGQTDGVGLETYANGRNWGVISTSQSGRVFSRVSTSPNAEPLAAPTRAELLADPTFVEQWAEAGLTQPAAGDSSSAPPAASALSAFYDDSMAGVDGVHLYSVNGSHFGYVWLVQVQDADQWVLRQTQVDGVDYNMENGGRILSGAEVRQFVLDGAFDRAWADAGLERIDLDGGLAKYRSQPKLSADQFAPRTSDEQRVSASMAAVRITSYDNTRPVVLELDEPDSRGLAVKQRPGSNGTGVATAHWLAGTPYEIGLVKLDGTWQMFFSDDLSSDDAFKAAASKTGVTPWW